MQLDERRRRWSNVLKLGPHGVGEEMMDFLQLLPKEVQILALKVRSAAGETGFHSFPFRGNAFDRFESYCLTKAGWSKGRVVSDETPVRYIRPRVLNLAGFGTQHLPGLVLALREIARGTCRCPALDPEEVEVAHVRSTLPRGALPGACLSIRARAVWEGVALRVVSAEGAVSGWPAPRADEPLALRTFAELLMVEPPRAAEERGPWSTAPVVGIVRRLWTEALESGLSREEAAGTVVVSSFCYPALHLVLAQTGAQFLVE